MSDLFDDNSLEQWLADRAMDALARGPGDSREGAGRAGTTDQRPTAGDHAQPRGYVTGRAVAGARCRKADHSAYR